MGWSRVCLPTTEAQVPESTIAAEMFTTLSDVWKLQIMGSSEE